MSPINWKRVPFVRIVLAFGLGIYLAAKGYLFPATWQAPLLLILGLALIPLAWQNYSYRWRWFFGGLWFCWLLLFGQFRYYSAQEQYWPQHFQQQLQPKSQHFVAEVLDFPKSGKRQRLLVRIQGLADSTQQWQAVKGKAWLNLPTDSLSQALLPGDWLQVEGILRLISPPSNPLAFDYQAYSANQQVYHQCFVKPQRWKLIEAPYVSWRRPLAKWRSNLLSVFEQSLEDEDARAILSALTLGYKDDLSTEIREDYAASGAMHVLAVSGLHVGLVAGVIGLILTHIRLRQRLKHRLRFAVLLSVLWLFALLTGAAASVLRATCMFSFVLLGQLLRRPLSIYNSLAVSAFVLLCWSPNMLFEVGFQLSYSAVLGIVIFQRDLQNCWYPANRLLRAAWILCTVSMAAQLGTLGFSLYYFHQFPSYFWLSGLIVIPLATVLLPLGLSLLFLAAIPPLRQVLAWILELLLGLQNYLIAYLGKLPYPVIEGFWLSPSSVLLLYALIAGIWYAAQYTWQRLWLASALLLVFSAHYFHQQSQRWQQVEICAFQLYNGSAVSLVTGQKAWNYTSSDADGLDYARANYFMALGVREQEKLSDEQPLLFRLPKLRFAFYRQHELASIEVDVLYIDSEVPPPLIWKYYRPKKVIYAKRLWPKKLNELEEACAEWGCSLHYIPEQGAWRRRF